MRKNKIIFAAFLSLSTSLTSVKPLVNTNEANYSIDDYTNIVEETNKLFSDYYKPQECLSSNHGYELIIDNEASDNIKEYWRVSIENIYTDLSFDQKKIIEDIKNQEDDFNLAFSILDGKITDETKLEAEVAILDKKNTLIRNF